MTMPLKPPPGPGRVPPLDDLRALQRSPLAAIERITHTYGDLVRYPLGPLDIYVASHPDYVKHVLQDNNRNYSKATFQYDLLKSVTGEGLLTSDGPSWLRQRRIAQPAFHQARIDGFVDLMEAAVDRMLGRWQPYVKNGEPVDVAAEMMRVALDIVGQALFGTDMGSEAADLSAATQIVLDHIVWRARTFGAVPAFLPTHRNRRYWSARSRLDQAVYRLIEMRRRGAGAATDLLAMLVAARDPETGASLSDRQLRDEIITLLVAGHETVASGLAWTWYLLAKNPAVEARLREQATLPDRQGTFDPRRMDYARMVYEEALRLYPPAWIITRRALGADEIGGYTIPKGAVVALSPYVTQRDPRFWDEPERFDPERFAPERVVGRPRYAYFPFGGGPRLCIGRDFALIEAQVVLSRVASRYRLELVGDQRVEIEAGVTLRPKHGLKMRIRPFGSASS